MAQNTHDDIDRLAALMVRDTPLKSPIFGATLAMLREEHDTMTPLETRPVTSPDDAIPTLPALEDEEAAPAPIRLDSRRPKQSRLPLALVAGLSFLLIAGVVIAALASRSTSQNTPIPAATPNQPSYAPLNLDLTYPGATQFPDKSTYSRNGARVLYFATTDNYKVVVDYYTHLLNGNGGNVFTTPDLVDERGFTAQNTTWLINGTALSPVAWQRQLATPTTTNAKVSNEVMKLLKPDQTLIEIMAAPLTAFNTQPSNVFPKPEVNTLDLTYKDALPITEGSYNNGNPVFQYTTSNDAKTVAAFYTKLLQDNTYSVESGTGESGNTFITATGKGGVIQVNLYTRQQLIQAVTQAQQKLDTSVTQTVGTLENDINILGSARDVAVDGQTIILITLPKSISSPSPTQTIH